MTRPILVYGFLELGIAVAAILVPLAIQLSIELSSAIFAVENAPPSSSTTIAFFYLLCSFVILLVPTSLMGATLPLLARSSVERDEQIGPRVGSLYATNTLGAVCGAVFTAFVLLPNLGLRASVYAGAGVNFVVFLVASLGLARRLPLEPPVQAASAGRLSAPLAGASVRNSWVLPVMLFAGVTSFTYEVLWARLLGHILGGSTYAFATMLATFLLGLTAGSAIAARIVRRRERAVLGLAVAQAGVALFSYVAFLVVDALPLLASALGGGASGGLLANAALCAVVILPSTLWIGATFPLAVRALAQGRDDAAPASARVFAWNTVGAIGGSVSAGFFLIPQVGYAGALSVAVAVNLVLAAFVAWKEKPGRRRVLAVAAGAVVLLFVFRPPTPWRTLRFRPLTPEKLALEAPGEDDVAYYAVGQSATVLVVEKTGFWELRTDGNPEAAVYAPGHFTRATTPQWLTGLPALARPEAKTMLVIGLGGGALLEALPRSLETVHVVELEPEVVEANKALSAKRAIDPLADERITIFTNDGRGALHLTRARYDLIVSQPSHPWTTAASHLYTSEFFELVRDHLEPGGVFLQWIGVSFVDEPLFRTLIATLVDSFPHVRAYRPTGGPSVLFLCSDSPMPVEQNVPRAVMASPAEFRAMAVQGPEDVAATFVLDDASARRISAGAPLNTDDRNALQMRSPRVLAGPLGMEGLDRLLLEHDPMPRVFDPQWDSLYLHRILRAYGQKARARSLLAIVKDPAEKLVLEGRELASQGKIDVARDRYREALRLDAGAYEPRVLLARSLGDDLREETIAEFQGHLNALPPPARAALVGRTLLRRQDHAGLESLDAQLAQVAATDPVYDIASRLRAMWREASQDPERAREAIRILGAALPFTQVGSDQVLLIRLHLTANEPQIALSLLLEGLESTHMRAGLQNEARALLQRAPPNPALDARRAKVEATLRAISRPRS